MCAYGGSVIKILASLGMTVLGERIDSYGGFAACLEDGVPVSQPSSRGRYPVGADRVTMV